MPGAFFREESKSKAASLDERIAWAYWEGSPDGSPVEVWIPSFFASESSCGIPN
jgi:hypothetical protein